MVAKGWVPDAGDIIWLNFDPRAGHEQAGHRPAIVLSSAIYNGVTGMLLCVPMTTRVKGYSFEVRIAGDRGGVALADQVKSFDWRARRATRKGKASPAELDEIKAKLGTLIG